MPGGPRSRGGRWRSNWPAGRTGSSMRQAGCCSMPAPDPPPPPPSSACCSAPPARRIAPHPGRVKNCKTLSSYLVERIAGGSQMSTAKENPPARPAASVGRWLNLGRSRASRHRDVQGGTTRATVLGAGDGLLTNLSLVLGVAGASTNASAVRLAGVAGLLAGAFSMAAGELVSVRAQQEMVDREIEVERGELAEDPEGEQRELAGMYRAQGLSADDADTVARILSANPDIALDTHARLELGVDPEAPGSAWRAAISSFLALALGATIGLMSGRNVLGTALRQLAVAAVAAAVTYGVGSLLGVSTS